MVSTESTPDSGTIPTLYDDTPRGRSPPNYEVATIGNRPNLIGHIEHHDDSNDGSFTICVAGGSGVVVSQTLWESIPEQHRPPLNTSDAGTPVPFPVLGSEEKALGSVIFPVILTNAETGERFRIKIHALVLPNLQLDMFISHGADFVHSQEYDAKKYGIGPLFTFDFGNGGRVKVKGC